MYLRKVKQGEVFRFLIIFLIIRGRLEDNQALIFLFTLFNLQILVLRQDE